MTFTVSLKRKAFLGGFLYLLLEMFALPVILSTLNAALPQPLNAAMLNVVFFAINFMAVTAIMRHFLLENLAVGWKHISKCLLFFLVGVVAYFAVNFGLAALIKLFFPNFSNINDNSVANMLGTDFWLMAIGTVVLVPVTEELLFRGVLFRGFYDRSSALAWVISVVCFALIHVLGFVGSADALTLFLCFVQYLPAGLILCWCYCKTDSILTPILIHMAVNLIGILILR